MNTKKNKPQRLIMKILNFTLILILLSILGLNAQEKYTFSEEAQTAFKKIATPESTLRWMTVKETEKVPKAEFLQKSKAIFDLDEKTDFTEIRVNKGSNGWLHYRMQQTHNSIPILGAEYLIHEKNGLIETANGDVLAGLNISTTPSISEEVALQMLLNEIGAETYAWEDDFSEKMLKHQQEDVNATYFPKGELIIVSTNGDFNPENFTLGYKFRIKTIHPFLHADYVVDAFTGLVVYENSLLCQATGTCQTHRYGQQTITTKYSNNIYSLIDEDRNIETYNGLGFDSDDVSAINNIDSDNIWNNIEHRSACEAHWVIGKTHDYFLNKHNWRGYDGFGSKLLAWVNVGNNWVNATGSGGKIYLGEGDGESYGPLTAIDIVAHEFTHNVIQNSGALRYRNESGALNESFADIFGTMVEFYAEPNANDKDWLLGEDISLIGNAGVFRDMGNPTLKNHPDTYEGEFWYTGNGDYGGVHTNSGVQNHWFYILTNGKSGTNDFGYDYNVSGIGMTKAAKLAMENLKSYLSPFSDYKDARNGSIQAATALGFTTAEINQVKEAWCAVGLGDCDINTTGEITVTSPNGGETLEQGIAKNITWNRTGNTGAAVKIEYSVNAGNEWHVITNATSNDGVYQWFPPSVETNLALVRVSSLSNETIYDSSDDYFSINTCSVQANFDANNQYPCENETVIFTSTSTGGANTYKWYINGILNHTGPTFNHNFSQAGSYEIELRASIGNNCGDVETLEVYVQSEANADFSFNINSQTINFIAPDNAFDATYIWNTGDGEEYYTRKISKVYRSAGTYTVCLAVNSSCGYDNICKNIQATILGCLDPAACNYDANTNLDNGSCIYGNCNNCLESDSLALIALYNATDGPNWTITWDLTQPVNTWHGIEVLGCHVTGVFLNSNNLFGNIPSEIGNLQNLSRLRLDSNNLSGEIPNEIGNLQILSDLRLGLNNLSGEIPSEIGNLQNLQKLHLNYNNLSGEIPNEIGTLPNLFRLLLYSNNLSGEIPAEIFNLHNLEYLNLSENSLSGNIPAEIGNLHNLEYLNLKHNNLSGEMPIEIFYLHNLKNLELSFNNLSGEIPAEIDNLHNLEYLELSFNNLSGEIPAEIGNLSNLYSILLQYNNLSGEIPVEIGNLQNLVALWLHYNNLSGCYPASLCSASFDFNDPKNYFNSTGNSGLPDNGSIQGFQDFCNGTSPCNNTTTEVYPGDLNFDGIANHKDILAFGIYNGEYGLERDEAYQDINWSAHPSSNWGAVQENTSDLKHTDADGNGVVDLRDIQAITNNYGQTHTASPIITPPNTNTNSPIEVNLQVNSLPSFIGNDDQLVLDIKVEDINGSNLALYGSYFTIYYNDPDLVMNDIEVVFNPSWFGTPNQNAEYITHHDAANNKIDIGITRVDHQNAIGEGTIGQIIAGIDNDSSWGLIELDFIVSNIGMQDVEAFALPVGTITPITTIAISQSDCEPSINITSSTPLSNHAAQGLIWTTGNISINESEDITFGSDRLKMENIFYVENGGEFTYYNDPCVATNRDIKTNINVDTKNGVSKNLKSYNYQIDEENLIYDFELNASDKVAIEIVDRNGEKTKHSFGIKQSGQNQIILPLEKLPDGEFLACLKIGSNRYYTRSGQ